MTLIIPTIFSQHFTYAELVRSEVALRRGIYNEPVRQEQINNLSRLTAVLLEPGRTILGVPLHVTSGYRSPDVNRLIGGAQFSAHLDGRAADLEPVGLPLKVAFDELRRSNLPYDQIIIECNTWIHFAVAPVDQSPRRQALAAYGAPGHWRYEEVRDA